MKKKRVLQEELKKIEQEQEDVGKKKIELDSICKQYEEIEKRKLDEQDKNLADKKLEEENIQKKETEKIKLQDSLNN